MKIFFKFALISFIFSFTFSLSSYPIHWAAKKGNLKKVKKIVENGTDINILNPEGITPLLFASAFGHLDIVQYLLNKGADINADKKLTPLHAAVANGHLQVVQFLLRNGFDVNMQAVFDITPLHLACAASNLEMIQYLLRQGANLNQADAKKRTPFDMTKNKKIQNYLKNQGAKSGNQ